MSVANPLWGAPRIHGELLKLGIDVGQTTVAKYMARRRQLPSQGWKTEAYGWQQTPRYIVRDRDCVYGNIVPADPGRIAGKACTIGRLPGHRTTVQPQGVFWPGHFRRMNSSP
jgi:hypothetical protein